MESDQKQSKARRIGPTVLWASFGLMVLMILAAIATPNLLRSRIAANHAAQYANRGPMAEYAPADADAKYQASRNAPAGAHPAQDLRKMVKTATMDLEVSDVSKAVMQAVEVARTCGGYVEQSHVSGATSGSLTLRVPAERFDEARASLAGSAKRVNSEQVNAADVTSQYVDLDSQLRNARAEEAQYLEIMKRAGDIKDTLAVAERLANVRGRIERMQGQLNLLSHRVEMATISVTIRTVTTPVERALEWHPVRQIRESFLDGAQALADYSNTMIALAMYLPAVLAWCGTIGFGCILGWKALRWTWRRWFVTEPAQA
jgi:hypothetical protein